MKIKSNILDSGKMDRDMVLANFYGRMVDNIKVFSKMETLKVMACISGAMVIFI
jgi:hypothetical protein